MDDVLLHTLEQVLTFTANTIVGELAEDSSYMAMVFAPTDDASESRLLMQAKFLSEFLSSSQRTTARQEIIHSLCNMALIQVLIRQMVSKGGDVKGLQGSSLER